MVYIETESNDVSWNLALEYYFAAEKPLPDTIFLFWPTRPTLVVGKYQNILEEINKPYADAHGIQIVRRLSGGGTIYADDGNWMYTFIRRHTGISVDSGDLHDSGAPREKERCGRNASSVCDSPERSAETSIQIDFHQYLIPVLSALAEMGVEASFNGRNDLVIGGKKFSGNSQYRLKDVTVHHGTMMFDVDVEAMTAATNPDSATILSKSVQSVRSRVTNIAEHLPEPMDRNTFKEIMVRHIMTESYPCAAAESGTHLTENSAKANSQSDQGAACQWHASRTAFPSGKPYDRNGVQTSLRQQQCPGLDITGHQACYIQAFPHNEQAPGYPVYVLTPEDRKRIGQIADERFRGWDNSYGRSPKFNIDRTARLAGGRLQFRLEVRRGIITEAALYGDFFSSVDADEICAALTGCRYERSAVLQTLRAHGVADAVYRVTPEELVGVIVD